MRAKSINEIDSLLKPKDPNEIKKLWNPKWKYSYEEFIRAYNLIKELNIELIKPVFFPERSPDFKIYIYVLYYSNGGFAIGKFLFKEDAEKVKNILEKYDFRYKEYEIAKKTEYLQIQEVFTIASKKLYNIKDYPEKGLRRII